MSSQHDKRQFFHNQIRKDYIKDLFAKRRIQMQQSLENYPDFIERIKLIQKELPNLSIHSLQILKNITFTQKGILQLNKSIIIESIPMFMQPKYLDTEQQYLSSWILGNIFYCTKTLPNSQFIDQYIKVLSQSSMKIKQNCLIGLNHLLHEIDQFKFLLIQKYNIVDIIFVILNSSPPNYVVEQTMKIIFLLVHKNNKKELKFKKILKFMFQIIKYSTQAQIILLTLYCLNEVSRMLEGQIFVEIKNNKIIEKLIEIYFNENMKGVHKKIINLITINIKTFQNQQFYNLIFPYLQMQLTKYPQLQIQIYKLCYDFLKQTHLTELFIKSSLFNSVVNNFIKQTRLQVLTEQTYLLCIVLLNQKSIPRNQIIGLMSRIKQVEISSQDNLDLSNFLKSFHESFQFDILGNE